MGFGGSLGISANTVNDARFNGDPGNPYIVQRNSADEPGAPVDYGLTNEYHFSISGNRPYYTGNMPTQDEVDNHYGIDRTQQEPSTTDTDVASGEVGPDPSSQEPIDNEGGFSLASYMQEHPGLSYEQYMSQAAQHSDEFAEKWLDYLTEKGELEAANKYTANREDTAYQRLVQDLRAAGLNPALMYGSSASVQAGPSQGYIKMTEGANNRSISNRYKLENLLVAIASYALQKTLGYTNTALKVADTVHSWKTDAIKAILSIFGF